MLRRDWARLAGAAVLAAGSAAAAPPPISAPSVSSVNADGSPVENAGFLSNLKRSNFLLGDLFGVRTELSKFGISLAIQETSEVLGNPTGGRRQGATYDGLTQNIVQLDTQRAFGWHGGLLNVSALQLHGRNLSADTLLSLQTASGIEADRSTRLWEAWYQQKLLPEDRLDVRIGQQSVDQEFIVTQNGAYFVNTMFGWPAAPSYDFPGGGPAYPLSALGVRFRYRPTNAVAVLAGVYNGSPAPTSDGDPQKADGHGVSFPLNGGTLAMVELQYAYPAIGGMVYPGQGAPLGHTYKVGAWYNSERFDDQRSDHQGLSLADPASDGTPRSHRGQYGIYAVADQMVWRDPKAPNRSASVFGRVIEVPQSDRNLIDFSLNAGVVLHGPFITRLTDTVGLGMGYTHVSQRRERAGSRHRDLRGAVPRPQTSTPSEAARPTSRRPTSINSGRGVRSNPICSTSSIRVAGIANPDLAYQDEIGERTRRGHPYQHPVLRRCIS